MKSVLGFLNRLEEWTLVLVLLGLASLTCLQVFCRYVLDFSFSWTEELARYLGVFITFLGASLGVKHGVHFSMDLFYERVSSDRARHGMQSLVSLLSGMLFLVVAWFGWRQAMKLRQFGVLTSALELPKYWAYLPVPFFSIVMSVRYLKLTGFHFARMMRGEPFRMSRESR